MRDEGTLVAVDRTSNKVGQLLQTCKQVCDYLLCTRHARSPLIKRDESSISSQARLTCVRALVGDSAVMCSSRIDGPTVHVGSRDACGLS
jgi:hypothetical protein